MTPIETCVQWQRTNAPSTTRQVLGSGWAELEALLAGAPRPADLSQIREAHDRYISAVADRALLRRPPAQP
jgi:hypothetical protein